MGAPCCHGDWWWEPLVVMGIGGGESLVVMGIGGGSPLLSWGLVVGAPCCHKNWWWGAPCEEEGELHSLPPPLPSLTALPIGYRMVHTHSSLPTMENDITLWRRAYASWHTSVG